jgi:hypothetical protein
MPKQSRLDEMPEFKRLSEHEKTQYTRRLLKLYATHSYPERGVELHKEIERIIEEVKSGHRVH